MRRTFSRRPSPIALAAMLLMGVSLPVDAEEIGRPGKLPGTAGTIGATDQPSPRSCLVSAASALERPSLSHRRDKTVFALDLLSALADGKTNVAVSPFGVTEVLAALHLGADVKMKAAIAHVLHLGASGVSGIEGLRKEARLLAAVAQHPGAPFASAEGLFVDQALKLAPGIADRVQAEGGLSLETLDFHAPAAIDRVNRWAAEKTAGRITSILDPGSHPSLVAVNALAFKDCWRFRFDLAATTPKLFHRLDGSTVDRPTMSLAEQNLDYATKGRFVAVELPYAHGDFALTLVTTLDAPAAPSAFTAATDLLGGVGLKPTRVRLSLPKFTGTAEHDLLGLLSKLGLAPGLASKTQFSGFADGLTLSALRQKTFVAVDEAGTEAAAVTAATMLRGVQPDPSLVSVKFDRPFVYVLRQRTTGAILMTGYVAEPAD